MNNKYASLHHDHDPKSIQERIRGQSKSILRDFVYGAIDGAVTTFAIVAGVAGANLEGRTVLILGFANVLADGFSMAASNYLATKSELEERKLVAEYEEEQIENNPEGETEEVRQIFLSKGIKGKTLEDLVKQITSNKREWLKIMMTEEYGHSSNEQSPWKAGLVTFTSFAIFGLIPLIPYMIDIKESFFWSTIFTGVAFFSAGAAKNQWTQQSFWRSGFETLIIGSLAALLAYYAGAILSNINF